MAVVDIIKNGYVFSNPSCVVRVEKTLDSNGDLINRTATNVSVKLTVPAGLTAVSFSSDTSGVTCDLNTGVVDVPVVSSDNPVTCYFMFRVDDVTTAVNSQWTIPISDQSGNPLFNFVFQPIIIGGLRDQDILDVVGALVGPPGSPGGPGPANALSIGSVTQGVAAATISGVAPSQVLDLVLPKGDTGAGDTLTIGTVTTVNPGDPAAATITGASPNKVLNLAIPQGETGVGGEVNVQADWDEADNLDDAYIKNKPVIPAAQVSADWNSVVSPTQILNKPTIPTLVSQLANDSGFITATLTQEQVQDFMGSALAHAFHTDATVIYNDAANRFEITVTNSGADGTITNMVKDGNNLVVTGSLASFSGTLTNIFKDTIFDAQRVGNILEWYVDGVKIKDINLCCTVTKGDVGLGNVPNVDATLRANHTGTQAQSTITNLVSDLAGKQQNLISGTNIKSVNGSSLLGSGDLITGGILSCKITRFTSTSVWTPDTNTKFAIIEALGAGGSGCGVAAGTGYFYAVGGGGTSGVYAKIKINKQYLSSTHAITIGAGGNGTTGAGSAGESTVVDNIVTVLGGNGGQYQGYLGYIAPATDVVLHRTPANIQTAAPTLSGNAELIYSCVGGSIGSATFTRLGAGIFLIQAGHGSGNPLFPDLHGPSYAAMASGTVSVNGIDARANTGVGGTGAYAANDDTGSTTNVVGGDGGSGIVIIHEFI